MSDPTFFERREDAGFQAFLARTFAPVIEGVDEACAELRDRAECCIRGARISAGAREAWKRRRAKWGRRGRAAR